MYPVAEAFIFGGGKPMKYYESTKYRYSDSWCYKANGTKTVITCEHAEGDGGPATYQKYTYEVH